MVLSELAEWAAYTDGVPRVSPATARLYVHATNSLVRFVGRNAELASVDCQQIWQYQQWLRDESGLSVVGANTYRRTLRALLRRAGRPELADHLKALRPPPRRGKAMSDEVLEQLLAVAGVRDRAIVMLLRDSGARRGAIAGLKRASVRLWQVRGGWRIAAQSLTKGDITVLLLGGDECARAVQDWLLIAPESSHLFCIGDGSPMAAQTINSVFRRLAEVAELPPGARVNPHALRHRFAQRMLAAHDAKVVSQLLGHAEVSTTLDVYGQRDEVDLMRLYYND